jgi:hypothetical protein
MKLLQQQSQKEISNLTKIFLSNENSAIHEPSWMVGKNIGHNL